MITIGLTIGAAIRNVSVSGTVNPRIRSPRAKGTLPHSQTGTTMPSSDSTIRRAHARRGIQRSITPGGTQTWTTIESTTPSATNGSDSISTLIASVRPSCARVGRGAAKNAGANASMRKSPPMTSTPMPTATHAFDARGRATTDVELLATLARSRLRTRRAQPEDVDDVLCLAEAVLGCGLSGPLLDIGRLDLDGQSARATDQVVVVTDGLAGPVQA